MSCNLDELEKGGLHDTKKLSLEATSTNGSDVPLTADDLSEVVPPHESYEGFSYWDPGFTWSAQEERKVVRKVDFYLLSALCLMFFGLQLDRGNLSNALTDNLLNDLKLSTNDYNNGTTIQLVCFLATEFPVQLATKRFGFRKVLPVIMMMWSLVSLFQCFMDNRTTFYVTRALIGESTQEHVSISH